MTTRKTRKNVKTHTNGKDILEQLVTELAREVDATEAGVSCKMSKGRALVIGMIDGALEGDQKMFDNVLKLVGKLDFTKGEAPPENAEERSRADWELIFAFHGKYKTLIEREIERLKETNPSYWTFDWFRPALESAPWYGVIHGEKSH